MSPDGAAGGSGAPATPPGTPRPRATATVMGLGLFGGGLGVAQHLVRLGYDVTVTDLKPAGDLEKSIRALDGLPVRFVLGRHDEADFTATDLVIANPAVPPGNRFLAAAERAGVRIDTEIGMFVRGCRGRIVGVTGSAGKSTTSALLHECLAAATRGGAGRVHLGGNIGRSLLDELDGISAADLVVLELSSFQLHWLRKEHLRPSVGVMTNIAPNHLDWHGTIERYAEDKSGIVPAAGGTFVALHDDPRVRAIAEAAPCRVLWTLRDPVLRTGADAGGCGVPAGDVVFWRGTGPDARLIVRVGGAECDVLRRSDVRLLGEHAAWNVATAAAAVVATLGAAPAVLDAVREATRGFGGLPHRLKPIATVRGVLCVDDSKSTTPDAAITALRAFDRPVLLLAGGYDKGIDPAPMIDAANGRARAVLCYGAMGPRLHGLCEAAGVPSVLCADLAGAVAAAFERAQEGDVLLLSPGHASWDQFKNYEERADVFARLIGERAERAE